MTVDIHVYTKHIHTYIQIYVSIKERQIYKMRAEQSSAYAWRAGTCIYKIYTRIFIYLGVI